MANGVCQVKKYIPTVDPLFAVILQAYKKVKVGKGISPLDTTSGSPYTFFNMNFSTT
jgi:hypothetical protein